jgi:hypothetical protein
MSNYELNPLFFDNPEHQPGNTSSIGAIWPPKTDSFERIKAFYNYRVINSERSMCVLEARFMRELSRLDGAQISRIQFRCLVGDQFLRQYSQHSLFQNHLEAIIPLERQFNGENTCLVYLGANHPITRSSADQDIEALRRNYLIALQTQPKTVEEIFSSKEGNGFLVEIISKGQSPLQDISQLAQLYTRFNWNEEEVAQMYWRKSNIIAVARDNGAIVSAGLAEIAQIPFAGSHLTFVEITEAATRTEYERMGLYTKVSTKLLSHLAVASANKSLGSEIDLVFGECNGMSPGVLITSKRQRRMFAAEVCASYGFPGRGILPQQVPIHGVETVAPYNDLLPSFLTPSMLYAHYLSSI